MQTQLYVQYGCGVDAPLEWINFDASPTLIIQKTPIIGKIVKNMMKTKFPTNVRYGNIIKTLPIKNSSCDGLYCSHVLEHLTLDDFRIALQNSYRILKVGGIFRCVVPDLESAMRNYIESIESKNNSASIDFLRNTLLGLENRPKGLKAVLSFLFGNSRHLWMWDKQSLVKELANVGFVNIRSCEFNDCEDRMFNLVENKNRFINSIAFECKK